MQPQVDHDDDEVQPMTLEAWLARRHAELAAIRAQAHKELDELFDVEDRKLSLDRYRIARDLNELTQH